MGICTHAISSSARAVDEHISGGLTKGPTPSSSASYSLRLPCLRSVLATRDTLHTALQALAKATFTQPGEAETRGSASSDLSAGGDSTSSKEKVIGALRERTFSKAGTRTLSYETAHTSCKSTPHFV